MTFYETIIRRRSIRRFKDMPVPGTIDFSSEITIPPNFTAERAENAETLEKTSGVLNTLKLCALCDLRVDKSLVFSIVPKKGFIIRVHKII